MLLLLASLFSSAVSAQDFLSRIYIGGGGGINISNDYTEITLQPVVGYRITDIFSMGILAIYEHRYGKGIDYTANRYGGGIFGRAEAPIFSNILGLVGHAELNYLRSDVTSNGNKQADSNLCMPVGFGMYTQSGRTRVSLVALWDLFHLSQYKSMGPTLRISITF